MRFILGLFLTAVAFAQTPLPADVAVEITGGTFCSLTPAAVALDGAENIYIAGSAIRCGDPPLRTKIGPGGGTDLFVIKLAAGGRQTLYSVMIGGTADEQLSGLSVDAEGQVWIVAQTASRDLPGLPQPAPLLAFAGKLTAAGDKFSALVPIGGSSTVPAAVLTGRRGELYVGGRTWGGDLSATQAAVGDTASSPDKMQGFIVKIDTLGQVLWRAILGGSDRADEVSGLTLGRDGEIIAVGAARSSDFPTTLNAWIRQAASNQAYGFVAAVSNDGARLLYSTLVDGVDQLGHVRADPNANIYAATGSGPFQVLKLSAGARSLVHRIAYTQANYVTGIDVGRDGTVYLTGTADFDFPTRNSLAYCAWNMPRGSEDSNPSSWFFAADSSGRVLHSSFLGDVTGVPVVTSNALGRLYLAGSRRLLRFDPVQLPVGRVAPACLVHGATYRSAPISPGSLMTIFGSNLGPPAATTERAEVTVAALPAPVLYASDAQVNFVAPWTTPVNKGQMEVCARRGSDRKCMYADSAAAVPAFFQPFAALNEDGSVNTPDRRALRGSVISLFLTGTGALQPLPHDGTISKPPLSRVVPESSVTVVEYVRRPCLFGTCPSVRVSHPAELLYAGAAPGLVSGVTQINLRVPGDIESTAETDVEFTMRDANSASVRVWIR